MLYGIAAMIIDGKKRAAAITWDEFTKYRTEPLPEIAYAYLMDVAERHSMRLEF